MRVLITRPLEEAQALQALLAERGIAALIDPLLEIRPLPSAALSLEGVQALLFTSANGVSAFAARSPERALPVFAVGARTAETARALGFTDVASADGAVPDLARLVRLHLDPLQGALLHGAGAVLKGELAALLEDEGFTVHSIALYEAVPAPALAAATREALAEGALDAVLFFSPRTAAVFVALLRQAGLAQACARLRAFSLSPAVAAEAAALPWRESLTAARPEQAALIALLTPERPQDSARAADAGPVLRAISAFGGIRPMAAKLGVPATTVQGWKERGHIPPARMPDVLAAAAQHGVALAAGDLAPSPPPTPEPPAAAPAAPPAPPPVAPPLPPRAAAAPAAPAWPRGAGLLAALWALASAALLLAAAVSLPAWGPAFGLKEGAAPPAPAAGDAAVLRQLGVLDKGLATIDARLGSLEAQARAAPAALAAQQSHLAEELAGNARRTAALEHALAELADRPPPAAGASPDSEARLVALAQEQAALEQRLGELAAALKQAQAAAARSTALSLAIAELREALASARPYDKPLAAVTALAGGDETLNAALKTLAATAASGVPTAAMLSERFDAAATAAARAAIVPERPGWLGETWARLKQLVVIRHSGAAAGNAPDAVLARAEALINAGELAAAVQALDGLSGPAAEAMRPWLAAAKARVAADAALTALALRAIAASGKTPS